MNEKVVKNYLKLFGVYNEEVDKQEKVIINSFLNTLKKKRLNIYDKDDYSYFEKTFRCLFDLESSLYSNGDVRFEIRNDEKTIGNFNYERIQDKNKNYINHDLVVSISKGSMSAEYLNGDIKSRLYAANYLLKGLYHEIEHYKQFKKFTSNISSKDNLRFAKEFIFSDEVLIHNSKPTNDQLYDINHDSFMMENNSNTKSFERLSILYDLSNIKNIKNCTYHKLDMLLSNMIESKIEGNIYDRDEYIDSKMDYYIKHNKYLLKIYPILLKEYNKFGIKRSISELLLQMNKEIIEISKMNLKQNDKDFLIKDIYSMYYELMYKRIKNNNTLEIKRFISYYGIDYFNNLIDDIKEYYRQDRLYKSTISKKKYELKCINDTNLNYLSKNIINKYIIYNNEVKSVLDYSLEYLEVNKYGSNKEIIIQHIIPRIPTCGYFILKDGTKILPNDFIKNYLVDRLDNKMKLNDVIDVLKELVLSTREQTYKMELESINASYQTKCSTLDNVRTNYNKKGIIHRI